MWKEMPENFKLIGLGILEIFLPACQKNSILGKRGLKKKKHKKLNKFGIPSNHIS